MRDNGGGKGPSWFDGLGVELRKPLGLAELVRN